MVTRPADVDVRWVDLPTGMSETETFTKFGDLRAVHEIPNHWTAKLFID